MTITYERLRERLAYDPETGVFKWASNGARGTRRIGMVAGTLALGYVLIWLDGRKYQAHRLAFLYVLGRFPVGDVDHIDGIAHNNAWKNLRECSRTQNLCNTKLFKSNKSGVKGVRWMERDRKWRAAVSFNRRTISLGDFDSFELAVEFRQLAAEMIHGEFVRHA